MRIPLILLLALSTGLATLLAQTVGDTQVGVASYYSDAFEGDRTAYNEIYRKNELVAAHSLYPHNSVVRVVNNSNGKSTTVRIIDQGPWIEGRIIEVSRRAAEILDFVDEGTTKVTLTLVSTPDQPGRSAAASTITSSSDQPSTRARDQAPPPPAPEPYSRPQAPRRTDQKTAEEVAKAEAEAAAKQAEVESKTAPAPSVRARQQPATAYVSEKKSEVVDPPKTYSPDQDKHPFLTSGKFEDGVYKVEIREAGEGNYGVQVAALGDLQSTMKYVATLQAKWFTNILIRKTGLLYKVILGPFPTQKEASIYAKDLQRKYKIKGFTVELGG